MLMTQNPDKEPKKRSSKTRKPSTRRKKQEELDEDTKLTKALEDFLKDSSVQKKKNLKNAKSIEGLLRQYMNSFILLGYTQDTHEMISIVSAKTEQHADSLSAALSKFLNSSGRPPNLFNNGL